MSRVYVKAIVLVREEFLVVMYDRLLHAAAFSTERAPPYSSGQCTSRSCYELLVIPYQEQKLQMVLLNGFGV